MNYKEFHMGQLIQQKVKEKNIDLKRICNFTKCTTIEIEEVYSQKSIDSEMLLKWCKLLEYDFFRLYSQHLILYAPVSSIDKSEINEKSKLPKFRKNIYSQEIIDHILSLLKNKEMTKNEIIEKYHIPKTTIYKWISKYNQEH